MTILIAGTVEMSTENRDHALADAAALMADTRSQPGCVHYVWSADPTSPTRIYVYEYWEDHESFISVILIYTWFRRTRYTDTLMVVFDEKDRLACDAHS